MKQIFLVLTLSLIACLNIHAQKSAELLVGPGRFNSGTYGTGKVPPVTFKLAKKAKGDLLSDFGFSTGGFLTYSQYSYDYLSTNIAIRTVSIGAYGTMSFAELFFEEGERNFDLVASIYGGYTFNIYENNALLTALSNRINTGISIGGNYYLGDFYALAEVGYMPQSLLNIGIGVKL